MAKATDLENLLRYRERIRGNLIVHRRGDARLFCRQLCRDVELGFDGRLDAYVVVACCSAIEFYCKALVAEVFDEYYYAIDERVVYQKKRFQDMRVNVAQIVGVSKDVISLGLMASLSVGISNISAFMELCQDVIDIHEECDGVSFPNALKEADLNDDWVATVDKRIALIENMFSVRHVVVHEVPFGRSPVGVNVFDFSLIPDFVRATAWLIDAADAVVDKYYQPRISTQPYVEAAYQKASLAREDVVAWSKRLEALARTDYERDCYVKAQKAWEDYADLFSDAQAARCAGTGFHTTQAYVFISLAKERVEHLKEIVTSLER